jgi:two-component system OmpR family response regulator
VRVLVVEDEVGLAQALRRGLVADGFTVDLVHDGVDGLWAATEQPYDVIVLDLMLPSLNGFQVLEQLRDREVWTPVLMLTATEGTGTQADAFDIGADDYLTKPFEFVLLVARLRALIRRGGGSRPAVLRAGNLVLDPARRRVRRGEVDVSLTPREFAVLEFLLRNCGDVMTKSQIMQNVWDENFDGDANIVEVYIRYLRKKVDIPFGRGSIQTVRGMGYRISDESVRRPASRSSAAAER